MASSSSAASHSSSWFHHHPHWKRTCLKTTAALALAGIASFHLTHCSTPPPISLSQPHTPSILPFASVSSQPPTSFAEPNTGVSFPTSIAQGQQLLTGTGLRKKNVFGLKNITVYAFGVYADEDSLKEKLRSKYTQLPVAELKHNKSLYEDIISSDFGMTVRLVIVYGRLKVGSVRSAFEDSIGSRIKKFSGTDNRPLLESFTRLFRDDIKLPAGTIIDITRHPNHILRTKIDGTELGSVQSPLLCRAFLDLYIGEVPFDTKGRDEIGSTIASLLSGQ